MPRERTRLPDLATGAVMVQPDGRRVLVEMVQARIGAEPLAVLYHYASGRRYTCDLSRAQRRLRRATPEGAPA